ncbi:uncharacterized protein BDZ99DRAFT_500528 [Mytilinidion resinicola]|uniref:BTB domain-containing protein n=1 Tax=Mytilinidion resinicola TaxID=574789 RepID=A0A6A6YGZ9_9PEZI|nr:uncharacterized protein BDZ99DRAFT_500528 [Mytilinidion resinicola]KAF2807284.1 hypothetical protein BDZ99DRAFT_500528 [Mytilinidion resinicola]
MGTSDSKPSEEGQERQPKPYGVSVNSTIITLNPSCRALYNGMISIIKKNKYSDLLVICGSDRYPVHRAVVCPRSTWFEDKCELALRGLDYSSPATPMKIWLEPGEEPHIIAAVLTYLYTLDYGPDGPSLSFGLPHDQSSIHSEGSTATDVRLASPSPDIDGVDIFSILSDDQDTDYEEGVRTPTSSWRPQSSTPFADGSPQSASTDQTLHDDGDPGTHPNALTLHCQIYLAAHRFGIAPLAEISKDKFTKALRDNNSSADLIPCIREVYRQQSSNPTASTLKQDVIKAARSRFRKLKEEEGWEALVIEFPEFAADMLRGM